METQNLWPDFPIETIKSPKSILKEQAGYLMAKTNNVLSAEIETSQYGNGEVSHNFYIVAPALNNYRYQIFGISHGMFSYPVKIGWNEGAAGNQANNQEEFLEILSKIFKDNSTVQVISSLLSQSLAG